MGLFREDESASQEVIGFMLNSFEDGFGVFLPPAGTTPHTLAAVLLHFLTTLPEPLLTFKCARTCTLEPDWDCRHVVVASCSHSVSLVSPSLRLAAEVLRRKE